MVNLVNFAPRSLCSGHLATNGSSLRHVTSITRILAHNSVYNSTDRPRKHSWPWKWKHRNNSLVYRQILVVLAPNRTGPNPRRNAPNGAICAPPKKNKTAGRKKKTRYKNIPNFLMKRLFQTTQKSRNCDVFCRNGPWKSKITYLSTDFDGPNRRLNRKVRRI